MGGGLKFAIKLGGHGHGGGGWGHHHHHSHGLFGGHNHYRYHHHHHHNHNAWLFAPSRRPVYYDRHETNYYNNQTTTNNTYYYDANNQQSQNYAYKDSNTNTYQQSTSYATSYQPPNNNVNKKRKGKAGTHAPKSTSNIARGINAYNKGNFSDAKSYFNQVIRKHNKNTEQQDSNKKAARRYLGKIALSEGNIEVACTHFETGTLYYEITTQLNKANKDFVDEIELERIEELLFDIDEAREFAISALPLFDTDVEKYTSIQAQVAILDQKKKALLKIEALRLIQISDRIVAKLDKSIGGITGMLFGYNAKRKLIWDAADVLHRQLDEAENNKDADINTTPLLAALKSKRTNLNPFKDADSWKAVPESVRKTLR